MSIFYVKNGGNDSLDGLSDANAWETINKVNTSSFNAGDSILFKRGSTWREQLTVPSSGSSGSLITFGAYGSGTDPIMSGANIYGSWTDDSITAGTNQHANPEAAGSWTEVNRISVSSDVPFPLAPDGSQTADGLIASVDNNTHVISQWPGGWATGQTWVASIYAHAPKFYQDDYGSKNAWFLFQMYYMDAGFGYTGHAQCYFNAVYGTQGTPEGSPGNITVIKSKHGWRRYSFSSMIPAGTVYAVFTIGLAEGNNDNSFQGDGSTVHLYVWGAKFEQAAALPTAYESYTAYYAGSVSTEPFICFEDGTQLERSEDNSLFPGMFWYDSGNQRLYIRTSGDDNPSGYIIEAGQRNYTLYINDKDYLAFSSIQFSATNMFGVYIEGGATYLDFDSCQFNNNFEIGLTTEQAINSSYITLTNCTGSRNGSHAVYFRNVSNSTISYGTWYRNGWRSETTRTELSWSAGIKIIDPSSQNNTFEYNESYLNGVRDDGSYAVAELSGLGLWFDMVGSGNIMRFNYAHDNAGTGIYIEKSQGVQVYYNISDSNMGSGISVGSSNGLNIQGENVVADVISRDHDIWNNICYGNRYGIFNIGCYLLVDKYSQDNEFKNNISSGNTLQELRCYFGGENDGIVGSGNVYTYNCLGVEATNFIEWGYNTQKSTYDDWEIAYGSSTFSVESDPLFVSTVTPNFHLQHISPCINAGVDVGLTKDYEGNSVPIGSAPDIGTYEFGGLLKTIRKPIMTEDQIRNIGLRDI